MVIQRFKKVKDLLLEKLDSLNAKTDSLNAKTDSLNAKTDSLNAKTDSLNYDLDQQKFFLSEKLQEIQSVTNHIQETDVLSLKASVDTVTGIQYLIDDFKRHQESIDRISTKIQEEFQKDREESQNNSQSLIQRIV